MKKNLLYTLFVFSSLLISDLHAESMGDSIIRKRNKSENATGIFSGIENRIKGGLVIGGTAPIPMPLEIQKIKSYNPLLNINLEAEALKMFDDAWGVSTGVRLDSKGMETKARVKNYNMKMVSEDDGEIAGRWTGMVDTKVRNSYLTLPVLAVWKPSPRWAVKLGPYVSYLLDGDFSGSAYDGYLREHTPVGQKIEVSRATYNFSDDLRAWSWGLQAGGECRLFEHLIVAADFTWGLNSIFKKDFEVITFEMYPIYLALSFGYVF